MAKLKGLSLGVLILTSLFAAMLGQSPSAALGQPTAIEMNTSQGDVAAYEDNVYVAGISTDGSDQVFLRTSSDRGNSFEEPVIVSLDGTATSPKVAAYSNNVYIIWAGTVDGANHVFFRQSSDSGHTFGTTIDLSNNGDGFVGFPSIAAYGTGVYAVWAEEDTSANTVELKFVKSDDGGATFDGVMTLDSENKGTESADSILNPDIAAHGNDVYVVWNIRHFDTEVDVFIRRSTDGGSSFEPEGLLTSIRGLAGGYPDVAASGDSIYVTWFEESIVIEWSDIFVIKSSDGGATFDEPLRLTNHMQEALDTGVEVGAIFPSVAISGQDAYVAWDEYAHSGGSHQLGIWKDDIGHEVPAVLASFPADNYSGFQHMAASDDVYVLYDNVFLKIAKDEIVPETPPPEVHTFVAVQNGSWDEPATWGGVSAPSVVDSDDTVIIPEGITVFSSPVENSGRIIVNGSVLVVSILNNKEGGIIENNGEVEVWTGNLQNSGAIENHGGFSVSLGPLYNSGLIHNTGNFASGVFMTSSTINTGTIVNDGSFSFTHSGNDGTIVNNGSFEIAGIGGTNNGLLNNTGMLVVRTEFTNWGTVNNLDGATLQNDNVINNTGTIVNFCGAQVINNGQILGNAVQQESCIDDLKDEVQSLANNGTISSGQTTSLMVKLKNTQDALDKANIGAACNEINAFVRQVNAMVGSNRLSDESSLLELAQQVKESIGCP